MEVLKKLNIELPHDPAVPLLGISSEETMIGIFVFSNSLLKFSVCSSMLFLSLLTIFMTISLNSSSGKLLGWTKSSSFSTRWQRRTQMNFWPTQYFSPFHWCHLVFSFGIFCSVVSLCLHFSACLYEVRLPQSWSMSLCRHVPARSTCGQWFWWECWSWSKHGSGLSWGARVLPLWQVQTRAGGLMPEPGADECTHDWSFFLMFIFICWVFKKLSKMPLSKFHFLLLLVYRNMSNLKKSTCVHQSWYIFLVVLTYCLCLPL